MLCRRSPCVCELLSRRFNDEHHPYTSAGSILVSINPFSWKRGLYSPELAQQYRGKKLGELPPHLFGLAEQAYAEVMRAWHQGGSPVRQCIVISGDSGAGNDDDGNGDVDDDCDYYENGD